MFKRFWQYIKFGKIQERITDSINGIPCEIEYIGRFGEVVGFWAYGCWHPKYPYKG